MRIISGYNKSRKLETLEGMDTRPMTDRMRETVFNVIGPYFNGEVCLDLFSGCGSLGFEALSRGASFVYFNDLSIKAKSIIKENARLLKEEDKCYIYNLDYLKALKFLEDKKFDIVFLDPPFRLNIIKDIIIKIEKNLNENAYIICQYVKGNLNIDDIDLELIKNEKYGISELTIFQKK